MKAEAKPESCELGFECYGQIKVRTNRPDNIRREVFTTTPGTDALPDGVYKLVRVKEEWPLDQTKSTNRTPNTDTGEEARDEPD